MGIIVHVSCENCEASFSLQEREAPPGGLSVRCTVCQYVFRVGPGVAPHEDLGWQIRTNDDLLFTAKDVQTLRQWANEGRLQQDDRVSRTGQTWIRLGDLPQMASVFQPTPAPVLTPPPAFGGGEAPVPRAPALHAFGQQSPPGAAPAQSFRPPAAQPRAALSPQGTGAGSSPSGSFPVAPGAPGSARAPTVLTRPGSGSFPVPAPPTVGQPPVAPKTPGVGRGGQGVPLGAPAAFSPLGFAPPGAPGAPTQAATGSRPPSPFTPEPSSSASASESGGRAVLRASSPFVPVGAPPSTPAGKNLREGSPQTAAASPPSHGSAQGAAVAPGRGASQRPVAPTPPLASASAAARIGVPQPVSETPSGIAADADRQLSRAFTDDDDTPLDSGETPRVASESASASQLSAHIAPDDASLNAMVTATFGRGEEAPDDDDDDDDGVAAEEPQDEADKAVARAPSVSVILGKEPQPRAESYSQKVRLEEEELYNDLEDDLLDEFDSEGGLGKKSMAGLLFLVGAACVASLCVPSLNQTIREATGMKVPLLFVQSAGTDAGENPVEAAAAADTDGSAATDGSADTDTTGSAGTTGGETEAAQTSGSTGDTGGDTTGTTGGTDDKPPTTTKSKSKKTKRASRPQSSSGGSGSLADKGCRYVSSGSLSKGISTLRKAFDRNPRDLDVLTCLGDAYRKKGNTRQARHYYGMALRVNKRYRPALNGIAKL